LWECTGRPGTGSATAKFTKCAHMVRIFVDGSAETFARKWRLFTSVSVTAPRYTTCPAVSKRSLGDAPSRAARPREAELGRQKATQPGIVCVNHSRQTATLNPPRSSSVPFCMAPLHGLSTHQRRPLGSFRILVGGIIFNAFQNMRLTYLHTQYMVGLQFLAWPTWQIASLCLWTWHFLNSDKSQNIVATYTIDYFSGRLVVDYFVDESTGRRNFA